MKFLDALYSSKIEYPEEISLDKNNVDDYVLSQIGQLLCDNGYFKKELFGNNVEKWYDQREGDDGVFYNCIGFTINFQKEIDYDRQIQIILDELKSIGLHVVEHFETSKHNITNTYDYVIFIKYDVSNEHEYRSNLHYILKNKIKR